MSDPQTLEELKISALSWGEYDDDENRIGEFIALAERRLGRSIFTLNREATATLSTTAETVALPTDFDGVRAIWLDTDPKVVLDQMSLGELRQAYSTSAGGQPGNYAISGNSIVFGPVPDSTYSAKLDYWQKITPLDDDNPTNWLLTNYPDLYLAATLAELFLFRADDRAIMWDTRTEAKIQEISMADRRKRYGGTFRIRSSVVV